MTRSRATPSARTASEHSPVSPQAQRIRRRRGARRASACAFLAVVVGAVWFGADALHARAELRAVAAQVPDLAAQVIAGDRTAAAATLTSLQQHAAAARADTHGPHWSVAGAAPWLGANVRAVQTASDVVDDLAVDALPALVDATSLVDPATFAPVDGRIDLVPLAEAAPQVVAADAAVRTAVRRLGAISPGPLQQAVSAPLADLQVEVGRLARTTATAARAARLLPPMLGADGPREYLLLVQSGAEQRATGGIPGQVVLLRATDGAVEVMEQRSGESLGNLPGPVLPLTDSEQALFGAGLGADMRDVTVTPDFPRSGQLARAIWNQQVGGQVDGVLSIDTGALAEVLGATGPVTLPAGQRLTADNVVELLLNTVYLEISDPAAQDAFFAATTRSVFDAVAGGQGDPARTLDALARAAREGRLMVWSAHRGEQALVSGTVLSGELVGARGDSPVIGVYLNDGSAAKIGYYLRTGVVVTSTAQRPDGSQALAVTVTLTSQAPANAADLPPRLVGAGKFVPAGEVRTNVLLYAPAGGRVDAVRVSVGDPGVFVQNHDGLVVVGKTVQLKPGERVVIDYDVVTGSGQSGPPVLRFTPPASDKSGRSD